MVCKFESSTRIVCERYIEKTSVQLIRKMAKRKLVEEFECVSAAAAAESANIHGVVASVSQ